MSCGVFVLAFLKHLLQRSPIPRSFIALEERQSLLTELRRADRSKLTPSQLAVIDGLRKGKTTQDTGSPAQIGDIISVEPSVQPDVVDLVEHPDDGLSLIGRTDLRVIQERVKAAQARVTCATEACERAKATVEGIKYMSEAMDLVNADFIPNSISALRDQIRIPPEFSSP